MKLFSQWKVSGPKSFSLIHTKVISWHGMLLKTHSLNNSASLFCLGFFRSAVKEWEILMALPFFHSTRLSERCYGADEEGQNAYVTLCRHQFWRNVWNPSGSQVHLFLPVILVASDFVHLERSLNEIQLMAETTICVRSLSVASSPQLVRLNIWLLKEI